VAFKGEVTVESLHVVSDASEPAPAQEGSVTKKAQQTAVMDHDVHLAQLQSIVETKL
jgi:hypothetical protein